MVLQAGVMTAMESYQEISGVPMVSSSEYLNGLLRHDIGYRHIIEIDLYDTQFTNKPREQLRAAYV